MVIEHVKRGQGGSVGPRAVRILAKSIYRELRENCYEPKEIVALATELLDLVTTEIRPSSEQVSRSDRGREPLP